MACAALTVCAIRMFGSSSHLFSHGFFSLPLLKKYRFYTGINISLSFFSSLDLCMHNVRFAPQSRREEEQTSSERKASLPLTGCLCVIHQRLTGLDEKISRMYYGYVVCLTRFHGDLCTAHFLILFHFLAFPQEGHLFCPFLIKVWSRRTGLTGCRALTTGLRGLNEMYASMLLFHFREL